LVELSWEGPSRASPAAALHPPPPPQMGPRYPCRWWSAFVERPSRTQARTRKTLSSPAPPQPLSPRQLNELLTPPRTRACPFLASSPPRGPGRLKRPRGDEPLPEQVGRNSGVGAH
jgi:hypothetical protein